ncbi:MAG: NADH-quinone oxidoreductase subunit NuoG [Moraxellaceae bacterium]|nr:NADH-quinone oxidoreductase subunit NuoG [Moraxellaceae bacterium]
MATIHVDGKDFEVDGADNLLQACLSLGLDIPYFCWHPALGSVGACRQCAVKQYANADDKRGRLVMSCMTPAADNTYISIDDEEAKVFRESVVEWLMTNHPHDCPVCEEGGHCHLQDMTVMTQHHKRRYRFNKRTHNNQDLGPFVNHEMNRCIACYRCVRYYKDYAGGTDLGVYGAHDNVYFGRAENGCLESEFSGNLTEVCPTGVFTDKTHSERYNRKWDMQFAPSICQGCSVGCSISPGERYGELRRIENRYNGSVNHYFLCDRGRFGYGFVNRKDRPQQPELLENGQRRTLGTDAGLDQAGALLKNARRVVGIGSARASLEANFALRELVGPRNFFAGVNAAEWTLIRRVRDILHNGPARTPSLREIEECDAAFVLGEDVTQTAPRIALALRQTAKSKALAMAAAKKVGAWQAEAVLNIAQHERSPIFLANLAPSRLDDIAAATTVSSAAGIASLGFAVAHAIDSAAPAVAGLDADTQALATRIADSLMAAEKPLVVAGTSAGDIGTLDAALNICRALKTRGKAPQITLTVPEVNSLGLALIDADPLEEALTQLENGEADCLVVLENNLYRQAPKARLDAILAKATLLVIDHQRTDLADRANVLLPAASFAEGDGTVINNEGRAQRFFQVFDATYYRPDANIHESWRWLRGVHTTRDGYPVDWDQLDHATRACAEAFPLLAGIVDAAPEAGFRIKGLKIARSPRRWSGRTSLRANISVHEPRTPQDNDTALAFSMEGYSGPNEPSSLVPFAWAPGWNSPQAWNKFQDEVGGHLRAGDPGVRLLNAGDALGYATPSAAAVRSERTLVPLHHIFGSDELSARADVTESRIPAPYVALNAGDAAALGLSAGQNVTVRVGSDVLTLPLSIVEVASNTVGLPLGLPGMPFVAVGAPVLVGGAA